MCLPQVYIAAFAISGYSTATFRNRYKPFNPVLGETYECLKEDRGFRFISEQVTQTNMKVSGLHPQGLRNGFLLSRFGNERWGITM